MSRCFSFPPPGYELKARPDDVNLIIKEKQKHKEHKDKKEKDKKEGSERKEKERSEHNHKEDKKRKRKEDKNNNVEEDKDKVKRSCLGVPLENQKLVPDVVKLGTVQDNGNGMLAIKDETDHDRVVSGQSLGFWESDKVEKTKEGNEGYGYRNIAGDRNDCQNEERIKIAKVEDKKTKEEKYHIKNKKEERRERKEEKRKMKEEKKKMKDEKKKMEEKKKRKEQKKKENNDCQGKLPKLKEFKDFLDAKDNGVGPYNISMPAIVSHKAGHTGGSFRPSQNTINLGVGERAVITDHKVKPKLSSPQSVIDGVRNTGPCLTANNRTDNGWVSPNNNVVSNGVISPHMVRIERKVEPYQTSNGAVMTEQIVSRSADGKVMASHPFAEKEGDAFHEMMHSKESRMNDSLAGTKSSKSMHSSAPLKGKEKVATTTKPPHPDMKYLSQILAVPEVEWPQYDDQEWLFDQKDSQPKRLESVSSEIQRTKQVWSEAIELDSADVTALPFVIPY